MEERNQKQAIGFSSRSSLMLFLRANGFRANGAGDANRAGGGPKLKLGKAIHQPDEECGKGNQKQAMGSSSRSSFKSNISSSGEEAGWATRIGRQEPK